MRTAPMDSRSFFISISLFILLHLFNSISSAAANPGLTFLPDAQAQSWRIHSLLEDGNLNQTNLFCIDFEADGSAWIATSDGLVRYDGYSWKRFTQKEGLPSNLIRSVCVTKKGDLWVGTDKGAGIFTGAHFQTCGSEKGLAGPSVRRIHEDRDGTLWFCSDRWPDATVCGGLTSFKEGLWIAYGAQNGITNDHVLDYFQDSQGRRFALTQQGLFQWTDGRWENPISPIDNAASSRPAFSIAENAQPILFVSLGHQIFTLQNNRWDSYNNEIDSSYVLASTRRGEILALPHYPQSVNCFERWNRDSFEKVTQNFAPPSISFEDIKEAPDGSIWCLGYDYLVRWDRADRGWFLYDIPLPAPQFIDSQNAVWFSDDRGSFRLKENRFEAMNPDLKFARLDNSKNVWGWSDGRIARFSPGDESYLVFPSDQTGLSTTLGFENEARNQLWFHGSAANGDTQISIYDGRSWTPLSIPELKDKKILASSADPASGVWYMIQNRENGVNALYHVTQDKIDVHDLLPQIPPFNPTRFLIDSAQGIWLYGHFGLFLRQSAGVTWKKMDELKGNNGQILAEIDKNLYYGFDGYSGGRAGWTCRSRGEWRSTANDFQDFLTRSSDGTVFLGGKNCLYVVTPETRNYPHSLVLPGEGAIHGAVKEPSGSIWLNREGKTYRFVPYSTPPDTFITSRDASIQSNQTMTAQLRAVRRFAGAQTNSPSFQYSYRIDDRPWSEFSSDSRLQIPVDSLSIGKHTLFVRSQDECLNIDPTPAVHDFFVQVIPLQERWWFHPVLIAVAAAIVLLSISTYSAKRKIAQYARNLESLVKERTASLQKSEKEFRDIYENAVIGIYRSTPDGRILMANPTLVRMLGYDSFEDLAQMNLKEQGYKSQYDRNDFQERIQNEGQIAGIESTWLKKDGAVIILRENSKLYRDASGKALYYEGTLEDITEQKRAISALRESEERFRSLVDASRDAMIEINSQGLITIFNPAAEKIFGYAKESMIDQPLDAILPENMDAQHRVYTQSYFAVGLPNAAVDKTLELTARRNTGELFPIDLSLSTGMHGEEPFVLAIVRDVSQRKNLEEQLRQSQKMEAIGSLAGGIAHDFNNLLTGVLGYSDLLLRQFAADTSTHSILKQIKKAGESAASLTRQLLAFSRKQILEPIALNLNELIPPMDKILRRLIGENIEIRINLQPNLDWIKADPGQIEQIILNLVVNARDAMPDGGRLTIETANAELDEFFAAPDSEIKPGKYVMLAISDTGHGIDKITLTKIFDPFFTTKEKGKGTGLGLSTVYGIVKQSEGQIFVYSELGIGTTFKIYLPVVRETKDPTRKATLLAVSLRGDETIFLVEDEEIVSSMIVALFQEYGYTIYSAGDHKQAVDFIERFPGRIHLLITDVVLPQVSGPKLAERLTGMKPDMKVLYMSGYTEDAIVRHGVINENIQFIHKPFTPEGILHKVRQILDSPQESRGAVSFP